MAFKSARAGTAPRRGIETRESKIDCGWATGLLELLLLRGVLLQALPLLELRLLALELLAQLALAHGLRESIGQHRAVNPGTRQGPASTRSAQTTCGDPGTRQGPASTRPAQNTCVNPGTRQGPASTRPAQNTCVTPGGIENQGKGFSARLAARAFSCSSRRRMPALSAPCCSISSRACEERDCKGLHAFLLTLQGMALP